MADIVAEVCHLVDCVTPLLDLCRPGTVALARVYNGKIDDCRRAADRFKIRTISECDFIPESVRTDGDRFPVPKVEGGFELYCGIERAVPFLFLGAIHKEDFDAVGGYNEKIPGRNDEDLANRLLARGTRFAFSGSAIAFHLLHGKS
jgi:hypothetical protein